MQVSLDPATVGTLEIDVLPDAAAVTPSVSAVSRPSASTVHLVGQAAPGAAVRLESTPDLSAGNWATLATVTADATGGLTFDDFNATAPRKFYRLAYP